MGGNLLASASMAVSGGAVICVAAMMAGWIAPAPTHLAPHRSFPAAAPHASASDLRPSAGKSSGSKLGVDVIQVTPEGDVVVAGRAEPRAKVALFDNGAPLAKANADPKTGEFVFLPPRLTPGDHRLALRGTVAAEKQRSAESAVWAFTIAPARTASPVARSSLPSTATATTEGAASAAFMPKDMATVAHGDTLWGISLGRLGRGALYPMIYHANATKIRDPDLIFPGQILTVPQPLPRNGQTTGSAAEGLITRRP
jgi:LysM domain